MRTTLDIDDGVMRALKRLAADEGSTLRSVIENALRSELARRKDSARPAEPEKVITFGGRGTQPGVNLDSAADLLDLMESRK